MRQHSPGKVRSLTLAGVGVAMAILIVGGSAWGWITLRQHRPAAQPPPAIGTSVPSPAPTDLAGPNAIIPAGRDRIRVPILEYHYIRLNPNPADRLGFNLSVTPLDFWQQMDWLRSHGYHPVTMAQLRAYFAAGQPLPAKALVLTFDDGTLDFYTTAWPILRSHGFTAVSYVVSGFFGRERYLTEVEARELDQAGIEIGS